MQLTKQYIFEKSAKLLIYKKKRPKYLFKYKNKSTFEIRLIIMNETYFMLSGK